jgi:GxxExxY protein
MNSDIEKIATEIVDIGLKIHKQLGAGLLESIYEKCFCIELDKRKINYCKQKLIDIEYENEIIPNALKIDILVEDLIIIELKAQENYHPVWEAQLLSYMKLSNIELGFIINFHTKLFKDGIKRMILTKKT